MNKAALDAELQRTVSELVRRLSVALRNGDTRGARLLWNDGKLAADIERVLTEP